MKFSFEGTLEEWQAVVLGELRKTPSHPPSLPPDLPGVTLPPDLPGVTVVAGLLDHSELALPPTDVSITNVQLPSLTEEQRARAWAAFVDFVKEWVRGFECPVDERGNPTVPQPDRPALMKALGEGQHAIPVLVMAYEKKSLQRMVADALIGVWPLGWAETAYVDRVASTMVQVSHTGFPDLQGTLDYSSKWRR